MTKGYIYTLYAGADPGRGWLMNDPIFGKPPTLGACMPNIRRIVEKGDWIFCISGRVNAVQQYVVGGFQVEEKIHALEAFARYPDYRLGDLGGGVVEGNIIIDKHGNQLPFDRHSEFEKRLENYLVGGDSLFVDDPRKIEKARNETLPFLQNLFDKRGNRVFDVVGRWRKLDLRQINEMKSWLESLAD